MTMASPLTVVTITLMLATLGAAENVEIDLFYESLCPYSVDFISNEVGPMNDLIGQDVHVNFVAYGNADTIDVDGGYEFKCQHGEDECYGNFVQACTEAHAPDYDTGLRLIVCMMSKSFPPQAGPECFQEFGLDYQPIEECVNGGEAVKLHYENGEFHNSQDPKPYGVPWINFNGVSDAGVQDDLDAMGMDLTAYICANFDVPSCL